MPQRSIFDQLKTLFYIGLVADMLASFLLWLVAPTDGIHVWYPWLGVYLIEYLGIWVLVALSTLGVVTFVFRGRPILEERPYIGAAAAAVLLIAIDLAVGYLLWPWRPTLWPGNIDRMLKARLLAIVVALPTTYFGYSFAGFVRQDKQEMSTKTFLATLASFSLPVGSFLVYVIGSLDYQAAQTRNPLLVIVPGIALCFLSLAASLLAQRKTLLATTIFALLVAWGWIYLLRTS